MMNVNLQSIQHLMSFSLSHLHFSCLSFVTCFSFFFPPSFHSFCYVASTPLTTLLPALPPPFPLQARKTTAAAWTASASRIWCVRRNAAAKAPWLTALTSNWPAYLRTSPNTPQTCKSFDFPSQCHGTSGNTPEPLLAWLRKSIRCLDFKFHHLNSLQWHWIAFRRSPVELYGFTTAWFQYFIRPSWKCYGILLKTGTLPKPHYTYTLHTLWVRFRCCVAS